MRPSELDNIYLPDSWVLGIEYAETWVIFVLDAVLEEGHPRFYWPPKQHEQYAYARLAWRIEGDVHWNEGPNLNHPALGPNGERDYGNIDVWTDSTDGGWDTLEGEWGCVTIGGARHTVAYLDAPNQDTRIG